MEILKALLSFILGERAEALSPLIDALKDNSFDLLKFLSGADADKIAPLIKEFFGAKQDGAFRTEEPFSAPTKLSAIEKIADEEIVATLNRYFESDF